MRSGIPRSWICSERAFRSPGLCPGFFTPSVADEEGRGGRNVETKYGGPDGVMVDVSQAGWVGTDAF